MHGCFTHSSARKGFELCVFLPDSQAATAEIRVVRAKWTPLISVRLPLNWIFETVIVRVPSPSRPSKSATEVLLSNKVNPLNAIASAHLCKSKRLAYPQGPLYISIEIFAEAQRLCRGMGTHVSDEKWMHCVHHICVPFPGLFYVAWCTTLAL